DKFLTAAPSFHEMGIFYHLLTLLKATRKDGAPEHELIIIDMPATGHTLALTSLPDILLRLIPGGPIARAMREGQGFLNDPRLGEAWVVTLPEQLPVTEAIELLEGLRETRMAAGGVVLNRYPADPFTPHEREAMAEVLRSTPMHGQLEFERIGAAQHAAQRLLGAVHVPVITLPEVYAADDPDPVPTLTDVLARAMRGTP
ncbi:MAG: arsenic transporter, partial [Myxococcales bacterium]|nr:arsenic transporter [Myxococcales bacterium]